MEPSIPTRGRGRVPFGFGRSAAGPRVTARGAVRADLAVGLGAVGTVSLTSCLALGLPTSHVLAAAALWMALWVLVERAAPPDLVGPGLGPANRVTLARAVPTVVVAALLAAPGPLADPVRWWAVAASAGALALDGLDGRVARRTGSVSGFGARLDMEVDALLILALSALVWTSTILGPWVLSIGAMRYLFVSAAALVPALRAPLPSSRRRQAVCVVQSVALLACLAPALPDVLRTPVAGAALLALVGSFGTDVRWLLRSARQGAEPGGAEQLVGEA